MAATNTFSGWETAVLGGLGVTPTKQDIAWLDAWHLTEESGASFNPLNTTLIEPGATSFNSAGVRNYPSAKVGAQATVSTLEGSAYTPIVAALRSGDPVLYSVKSNVNDVALRNALDTWGSHSFASDVYHNSYPQGASVTGQGSNPYGSTPQGTAAAAGSAVASAAGGLLGGIWDWILSHLARLGLILAGAVLIILGVVLLGRAGGLTPARAAGL